MSAAETSDWYDPAIYPERRDAAPWVMEDMIEAQASLPEGLSASLGDAAPRLVEMLRAAAGAGEPIVVSGVGTSGHSARAVALILNAAMGSSAVPPARSRRACPPTRHWPRAQGGLCLAISHGGLSKSTVRALTAAREAGARTALITATGNTPAQNIADVVLTTPLRDKSVLSHRRLHLADVLRPSPRLGVPRKRVSGGGPRRIPAHAADAARGGPQGSAANSPRRSVSSPREA